MKDIRKFRTHIEILKHSHPEVVVQLVPEPRESPVEISGETPDLVLKWRGKTIHSVKSPEGEARHLLDQVQFENGRSYIVFGAGLGHLAEMARTRLPSRSALILVEPELLIFREVFHHVDFRALLYDNRVHWVSGKDWREHLRIALRRSEESGCRPSSTLLSLPAYRLYFKNALSEVHSLLAQFVNERDIDSGTRKELWRLWNHNLTENIEAILTSAPMKNFVTTFRNIPAILVGAGPSLDDNLRDLDRLKQRAFLIAVDTALAPMLAAGCEPDLVLAMDAQPENARDFSDLPAHSTTLLFDAFCYPTIPKMYPPKTRIASLTGHIFSDIDEQVIFKNGLLPLLDYLWDDEIGFLQNGGSVITGGFDLARMAGCSAIGLLGVDLSYPGFENHSKLTQRSLMKMNMFTRLIPPELDFYKELAEKSKLRVEGTGGRQVWADRVMLMYKHWMEDAALKTGLPCFTVGVSRGAVLKGYSNLSVDEFVGRFGVERSEITARLERCRNARPERKTAELRTRLVEIRKDLSRLDDDPAAASVGPFDLDRFVEMASYEVAEKLRVVLSVEAEEEHLKRRQQAARVCRQWVLPFLDRFETALNKLAG